MNTANMHTSSSQTLVKFVFFVIALLLAQPAGLLAQTLENQIFLPVITRQSATGTLNGDFEAGRVDWIEETESSRVGVIRQLGHALFIPPHSGEWAAWLGGATERTDAIEQQLVVPTDKPYLAYWHLITSLDDCSAPDTANVLVNGIAVATYSLCPDAGADDWTLHTVNLSAYAGQSIRLRIEAVNDEDDFSSLYVDDVGFQSNAS